MGPTQLISMLDKKSELGLKYLIEISKITGPGKAINWLSAK